MADTTPLMEQYAKLKREHRDSILFFRLGDFYEMFQDDAVEVSALLNLTLTHRHGERMCGIPYHASRSYVARLLKLGKKIAICEQTSAPGKGIMERSVVEVVTPGTILDEDFLDRTRNNYLACLSRSTDPRLLSFSVVDLSTGELSVSALETDREAASLRRELGRFQPREMVVQQSLLEDRSIARAIEECEGLVLNRYPDWSFGAAEAAERLKRQLGLATLKGFGLHDESPEISSCGALLDYVADTAKAVLPHLRTLLVVSEGKFLGLDGSSQRNLEIVRNLTDSGAKYTLLEVMDETRTGMGARLLRRRLLAPLVDVEGIEARLDAVDRFHGDQVLLSKARRILGGVLDLERLASRIALDRAHARDLLATGESIEACASLDEALSEGGAGSLFETPDSRERAMALAALLKRTITEEPSVLLSEGNLIRQGVDQDLDALRGLEADSRTVLEAYLEEERAATGLSGMKLRHNNIIGYYLEVNRAQAGQLPPRFMRRQGLANAERFTTSRLSEIEERIASAKDKIIEIERRIFLETRERAKEDIGLVLSLARAVAEADLSAGLAYAATRRAWVRPALSNGLGLRIREGRHPVVEAHLGEGAFVPNDLDLGGDGPRFALITGPNMAGKSTYLRQTALIVLMAQMGSFVPAQEARIGCVDRIYCRVGAQDNLARGESTFLVEMNETAFILNTATERSLVIMDEVGRGTSTTDGLAIAWAVSERLSEGLRARTLFATHYHELTALESPAIARLCLEAREEDGAIIFLKKVMPGAAASSYGVQVAALAGLPRMVLQRAEELRRLFEEREKSFGIKGISGQGASAATGSPEDGREGGKTAKPSRGARKGDVLFDDSETVIDEIRALDVDRLTPLEAITRIAMWKRLL
jgi:DNA mismatch repair protein MutS